MEPIILAAAEFELEPVRSGLSQIDGKEFLYYTFGVGAITAAWRAHELANICADRDVLYVGSCGLFGRFTTVEVVRATQVHWLPTGDRLGQSYSVPESASIPLHSQLPLFHHLPQAEVVCAPSVSLTDSMPNRFTKVTGSLVENIELYSVVVPVLQTAGSFTAILAVTNQIGKDAHAQWRANAQVAAQATADIIINSFKEG